MTEKKRIILINKYLKINRYFTELINATNYKNLINYLAYYKF